MVGKSAEVQLRFWISAL